MRKQSPRESRPASCCSDIAELLEPRFFKALGDPNRIALLLRLARCAKPCTVTELTACCPVNISVVSRHLALLRDAGILDSEKRGKEVYYSVRFPKLVATLRGMADGIEACCPTTNVDRRVFNHD